MRRIVLVLVIGSIVMFIVVLKMPLQSITNSFFSDEHLETTKAATTNTKAGKKPEAQRTSGRGKRAKTGSTPVQVLADVRTPEANGTDVSVPSTGNSTSTDHLHFPPDVFAISSDSAVMYSINSVRGTMLRTLNKGDIVHRELELIDASGGWAFVKLIDQNASGFVMKDLLEPPLPSSRLVQ